MSIRRSLPGIPRKNFGLSGGVFANVKLNRLLAEKFDLDEVFVFPAMGDDGLPVGGALAWLLRRDGLRPWLENRRDLGDRLSRPRFLPPPSTLNLAGRQASGGTRNRRSRAPSRRLEGRQARRDLYRSHGIRAARTRRPHHSRQPVAPRNPRPAERPAVAVRVHAVRAGCPDREKAAQVFDITNVNRRACRYMTIACDVRPDWRKRIPAVVHVDHSARPAGHRPRRQPALSRHLSALRTRDRPRRFWSIRASMCTRSRSSMRRRNASRRCATGASTLS